MEEKIKLRQEMKKKMAALSKEELHRRSMSVSNELFALPEWQASKTVAVTISRKTELSTDAIIQKGWAEGKDIVVPKVNPLDHSMAFYSVTSYTQLEPTFYDLMEPITSLCDPVAKKLIDLIIVPGLAFDQSGRRLGYGGGYYDRYLQNYHGTAVALAFSFQLVPSVPTEEHDCIVDYVLTEASLDE
ncbi:5-formyltetrahydrofolate cyclo-ligase [Halalkalibacterium ligniniphilum]|uniref:5-formyltetrahydrofolate cyclo-ligase n=1 Tax=Halalkalibacterium ligniniphilum TaxID=1134413 RepID=UPI0003454EB4|nr:5-formyltetrahydrofolate cyclo-ligase [Halalkalibacterium ligniniphilum]